MKQGVEEKQVKKETKEKEILIIQLSPKSQHDSQSKPHSVVGISLDKHVTDIVKTPDEVANLPVHEEADYQEFRDNKKSNEVTDKEGGRKEEKETDDVEDKVKLDETNKGSQVTKKKKKKGSMAELRKKQKRKRELLLKLKPKEDTIVAKKDEVKINEIKETKNLISETETKLQDLKKEVSVPVEEIKLDKGEKDLSNIEEPGQPDIKPKLDDITKIDSKLIELNCETQEVIVGKSTKITDYLDSAISQKAEIVETSTDHAEPAITEKAEVLVKKSTRSPEHAESVVLPDSSPEDDGPLVLKALDIDKLELGRTVAEVPKSEAPLEKFASKLPFTQEQRETHITTQDSPIVECKIIKAFIPTISDEPYGEEINDVKEDDESGTVLRILVTTSSEDGARNVDDEVDKTHDVEIAKNNEIKSADVATVDAKLEEEVKEVKFIKYVEKGAEMKREKVESPKDYIEVKTKPESDAGMVPKLSIGQSAEEPKDKVEAIPASPKKEKVTAEAEAAKHDELC
ncbi:unnamed protein product [Ceutorhynchus assimilis]|uniref:Uncharacterized protein n=1 Tax=Ceutorhynchus assimilis TaxID=467358 RepID=A0A9N9QSJ3_9CUCU|nr:unnamed protein product [Ceutorhynchus assimilis]